MSSFLELRIDHLVRAAKEELCSLERQLAKSRRTREASSRSSDGEAREAPAATPVAAASPLSHQKEKRCAREGGSASPISIGYTPAIPPDPCKGLSLMSPTASPSRVVVPTSATQREGTLLQLVRSSGLFGGGSRSFVPHYIVVSGRAGIAWYASEAEYRQHPSRPLGRAEFWIETFNSRGSRFKKAAVCWPLILPDDCPEASDPSKTYFAVDYYTPNEDRRKLVLAASSPAERDAWVQFLTKYIDLYLPHRAESEELQQIPRGAEVPLHQSGVIEGEAPGGNIL
ncbi:hypothetical protein JKF63_02728 [Porcisia hertigi]|uniref:PH domain-containing protein n=1 Tax=Porcisia hertigi TaxID=2761500 RepID=A0A836HNN4_9TRYP|nr:hypothetical protein JKF63_02728 [Porcisia hertigi]